MVAHIFTLHLASFAFKLVIYSRHSETLNFLKNSKLTSFSFKNSDFTVFKHFSSDSLCLQKYTNLDAKSAKRSIHIYFVIYEQAAVKNSLNTYVCSKGIYSCGVNCI